ncbi:MAG: DegV family protein, partial [Clostridia bacterium]|nr:DegV family protein [Clostridia bacterium]
TKFILSCCSTVDLSLEHLQTQNINYIPFHFYINNEHYYDDLGQTIKLDEFYSTMETGADVKTSQINASEYVDYFKQFLESGKDILHVNISSGISGSYNSAKIAQSELQPKYPDRKIYILDSLAASSGFGLFIDKLAELRDTGMTIDEVYNWGESNRLNLNHWFTSTDLKYFVKGGRVSKTAGFFGGLLKICPVLTVDKLGKLVPVLKVRTKQKALTELFELMKKHAQNGSKYNQKCYISHSACYEDAEFLANLIQEYFTELPEPVLINNIGTTVGSHTGPGTIALFFWGDTREN